MAIHYFHCTDGVDLILDRSGCESRAIGDAIEKAREVAGRIMGAVPSYSEWDSWAVHVYDETGPLEVVPFLDGRTLPPAPQKTHSSNAGLTVSPQAPR